MTKCRINSKHFLRNQSNLIEISAIRINISIVITDISQKSFNCQVQFLLVISVPVANHPPTSPETFTSNIIRYKYREISIYLNVIFTHGFKALIFKESPNFTLKMSGNYRVSKKKPYPSLLAFLLSLIKFF